jgi:hypothetical protein
VFLALKALGCQSEETARPAAELAATPEAQEARVSTTDVRHYCYHARAAGLVECLKEVKGQSGYSFYLTVKGWAIDPAQALKEALALKEARSAKQSGK